MIFLCQSFWLNFSAAKEVGVVFFLFCLSVSVHIFENNFQLLLLYGIFRYFCCLHFIFRFVPSFVWPKTLRSEKLHWKYFGLFNYGKLKMMHPSILCIPSASLSLSRLLSLSLSLSLSPSHFCSFNFSFFGCKDCARKSPSSPGTVIKLRWKRTKTMGENRNMAQVIRNGEQDEGYILFCAVLLKWEHDWNEMPSSEWRKSRASGWRKTIPASANIQLWHASNSNSNAN